MSRTMAISEAMVEKARTVPTSPLFGTMKKTSPTPRMPPR